MEESMLQATFWTLFSQLGRKAVIWKWDLVFQPLPSPLCGMFHPRRLMDFQTALGDFLADVTGTFVEALGDLWNIQMAQTVDMISLQCPLPLGALQNLGWRNKLGYGLNMSGWKLQSNTIKYWWGSSSSLTSNNEGSKEGLLCFLHYILIVMSSRALPGSVGPFTVWPKGGGLL